MGTEAEHPYGPYDLPAGTESADWGVNPLFEVRPVATYSHVEGYWVRGTEGGRPFVDFVDTFTAFCADSDAEHTPECAAYAEEHGGEPIL